MTAPNAPARSGLRLALLITVAVAGSYLAGLLSPGVFHVALPPMPPPPIVATGVVTYDPKLTDDGYVTAGVIYDQRVDLVAKDGTLFTRGTCRTRLQG